MVFSILLLKITIVKLQNRKRYDTVRFPPAPRPPSARLQYSDRSVELCSGSNDNSSFIISSQGEDTN